MARLPSPAPDFAMLVAAAIARANDTAISTVAGLDAEEAAQRDAGAERAERKTHHEQDQRDQREGHRLHVRVVRELEVQRGKRDLLAEHKEEHGKGGTSETAEQTFD